MVDVLALNESEAENLRWAFEDRDYAVAEYMESAEGRELVAEEASLRDAVNSRDLGGVRRITDSASDKRDRLREIVAEGNEGIRMALPESKRREWDAYRISSKLLSFAEPLGLTVEQELQIEEHAFTCIDAARAANKPNPMAAAFLALEKWSENTVLSPQQRSAYEEAKKSNPLRSLSF